MQTLDFSTITKRYIALKPIDRDDTRAIARIVGRQVGGQQMIIDILTGAYRATLDADGRLTTERNGETIDLGLYQIVWQGNIPAWRGESSEITSDIVQDFVHAELAAGRHGIVDRVEMPVKISRGALEALLDSTKSRLSLSPELRDAIEEAQAAVA
jgi:hypothetical protein